MLRKLLIALCLVALALLGAQRLIQEIPWDWPQRLMAAALGTIPPWVKFTCWAGAVLAPIGLAAHGFMTRGSRRVLRLEGRDKSTLVLRQFVIERLIRENLSELSEVDRVRVSASRTAKGLRVEIGLKAKGVFSLGDLENAIRVRAEESLRRILGIEKIDSIHIRLDDLSASPRVRSEHEARPEPPLPPPRAPLIDAPPPGQEPPARSRDIRGLATPVPYMPRHDTAAPPPDDGAADDMQPDEDASRLEAPPQPLEEQPRDPENSRKENP